MERVTETGSVIKFHKNELIEESSQNIDSKLICGNCVVFKARENESVKDILQQTKYPMAYVCRYKLIKKTSYKLVPVSWKPGEEEARNSGEMTDTDFYTDTEDQANENVISLSESINLLHLSLTNDNEKSNGKSNEKSTTNSQVVTPIKIVKNTVQKVARTQNQTSPTKRASPDAGKDNEDVSPSKRNKLVHNSNYDSPGARNRKYESPIQRKMANIKKNLNTSFTEASKESHSPYETKLDPEKPLTITISKEKRVLAEKNDNNILNKSVHPSYQTRRSILKHPHDSAKSENTFIF